MSDQPNCSAASSFHVARDEDVAGARCKPGCEDAGATAAQHRRFKLGSMVRGWVDIRDSNGKGYGITVARVYSLGRAEIVRDALESAYPRET